MKNSNTWTSCVGLSAILIAAACSSSNDNSGTTQSATGGATTAASSSTGGNKPTGGTNAAGGSSTKGGSSNAATGGSSTAATGGTKAATGGASNTATGGSTANGGSSAMGGTTAAGGSSAKGGTSSNGGTTTVGGSSTAGGSSAKGGTSAAGGSAAAITCPLDNASNDASYSATTAFCTPANPDLTLITGTLSLGTLNINATGGTIAISGTPPVTGALAYSRPFNSTNCANSGLNATVTGSNPAQLYTGVAFTIKNSATTSTTLNVYFADRVTVSGTGYYVVGTAGITVAAGATVTQTVKWSNLTTNCSMGSAANFDPTQILALALGFPTTDAVNLTISSVTFTTN